MAQWSRQMRPEMEGSPHHRMRGVHMTPWAATLASPYTDTLSTPFPLPSASWGRGASVHQPPLSPFDHLPVPWARTSGNWTPHSEWKPESLLSCLKQDKKQTKALFFFLWNTFSFLLSQQCPEVHTPFPEYSSGTHIYLSRPLFVCKYFDFDCQNLYFKDGGRVRIMMLWRGQRLAKRHIAHEWRSHDLNSLILCSCCRLLLDLEWKLAWRRRGYLPLYTEAFVKTWGAPVHQQIFKNFCFGPRPVMGPGEPEIDRNLPQKT